MQGPAAALARWRRSGPPSTEHPVARVSWRESTTDRGLKVSRAAVHGVVLGPSASVPRPTLVHPLHSRGTECDRRGWQCGWQGPRVPVEVLVPGRADLARFAAEDVRRGRLANGRCTPPTCHTHRASRYWALQPRHESALRLRKHGIVGSHVREHQADVAVGARGNFLAFGSASAYASTRPAAYLVIVQHAITPAHRLTTMSCSPVGSARCSGRIVGDRTDGVTGKVLPSHGVGIVGVGYLQRASVHVDGSDGVALGG